MGIALPAQAEYNLSRRPSAPKDYFDFEFAQNVWKNMNEPKLMDYFMNKCPANYDAWRIKWDWQRGVALQELESFANAEAVKKCHDVALTYQHWRAIHEHWKWGVKYNNLKTKGWNKNAPETKMCMKIAEGNIFPHSCNNLPDWRNPDEAKEDAQWLARIKEQRAADEIRRAARERALQPGSFGAAFEKATRLVRERLQREDRLARERLQQKAGH